MNQSRGPGATPAGQQNTCVRRWIVASLALSSALLVPGLGAGCYSSDSGPGDGGCIPAEASVVDFLGIDAGPASCQACISNTCTGQVETCSSECQCNASAVGALTCVGNLGGNATASALASCVSDLPLAADPDLASLGRCLTTCFGSCSPGLTDAEAGCATIDATASALETGSCGACLEASCAQAVSGCEADCACSSTVVAALSCLANLGSSTSLASATACVAPVESTALTDPALQGISECVVASCETACGLAAEASAPEASMAEASTAPDGGIADAGAPEAGPPDAAPEGGDSSDAAGPSASAAAISMGISTACAVTTGGAVVCWGDLLFPQPDSGPPASSSVPVQVPGLISGATSVAVGVGSACAVVSGGLRCWGGALSGQLGNGSNANGSFDPVQVTGLTSGVTGVSVGNAVACAVVSGGVQCWGSNSNGQLGDGPSDGPSVNSNVPVQVTGLTSGATMVSVGTSVVCAVVSGGVQCWGLYSQAGQFVATSPSLGPIQVPGLTSGVTAVSVGEQTACALVSGGVQCWGYGSSGDLGDNSYANSASPVQVSGLTTGVTAVTVGGYSACAVVDGGVQCWGASAYGALGDDATTNNALVPAQVAGLTSGATTVSMGVDYSACAVVSGGVRCWGFNSVGQLGNASSVESNVPVAVVGFP